MAVGDTLPHCTGTGTSSDPYKYSTAEGFKEAIAVADAYVVAAEENLVFDVNDGIIPSSLSIACNSLNGKGTTIRNLYRTTDGALISTPSSNKNTYISNMNFYNMMLINNTANAQIRVINAYNDDYRIKNFTNCNFTGIVRGSNINYYHGLIASHPNNFTGNDQGFYNCTFNFNIDGSEYSSTATGDGGLFWSNDNNYVMSNCTICISGKFNYDFKFIWNYHMINCTIMNKATNPIVIEGNRTISITQNAAEYNYFKPYITQSSGSTVTLNVGNNASKTLVNRSRIDHVTISGTCINMQETDAAQSDYIYNAQNLANAGFLVGTVIE